MGQERGPKVRLDGRESHLFPPVSGCTLLCCPPMLARGSCEAPGVPAPSSGKVGPSSPKLLCIYELKSLVLTILVFRKTPSLPTASVDPASLDPDTASDPGQWSIPPSIRVFSNESSLRMRWPKYWSFSFNIIPSKEIPGLNSFRMDWLDLLAVQGTLKSLLNTTVQKHQFFGVQPSSRGCSAGLGARTCRREDGTEGVEVRPSSVAPDPAESRGAPPPPQDPSPLRGTLGSSLLRPAALPIALGPGPEGQTVLGVRVGQEARDCDPTTGRPC